MTNNDFLKSLLLEKDLLAKNPETLNELGEEIEANHCLESIEILTVFTDYLSEIIANGLINGDAEKLP